MFLQLQHSNGQLIYVRSEEIIAFNADSYEVHLSSGASFFITEKASKDLFNRMCSNGRIVGLGPNAQNTQNRV